MYHHILCAVDFSKLSDDVLKKAKDLADLNQAKISLIHVIEYYPAAVYQYASSFDIEGKLTEDSKNQMTRLGREFSIPEENQHIVIGSPKFIVPEQAQAMKADLIMVGRHGKHGLAKLLGSTASAIASHTHCDVMIIQEQE